MGWPSLDFFHCPSGCGSSDTGTVVGWKLGMPQVVAFTTVEKYY